MFRDIKNTFLQKKIVEKNNLLHYNLLLDEGVNWTSTMVTAVDFDLPESPGVNFNN